MAHAMKMPAGRALRIPADCVMRMPVCRLMRWHALADKVQVELRTGS